MTDEIGVVDEEPYPGPDELSMFDFLTSLPMLNPGYLASMKELESAAKKLTGITSPLTNSRDYKAFRDAIGMMGITTRSSDS